MEYNEFLDRKQKATQSLQSGRLQEAVDQLYLLFLSDVSDIDKVAICTYLASAYDRMGNTEEVISWYNKGIDIEQNYSRFEVSERKAEYLSQIGRSKDAVPIYESLIRQPFVSEADKERMRKTIQAFLGQAMRQWK